jgi:hypothetical protein
MLPLMLAATLLVASPPARPRPAALVLDVGGQVTIKPVADAPRHAEIGDLLYPGERLAVPPDGAATLAILGVGAKERIKAGAEATVGPKGCNPPEAVAEHLAQKPAVASTMRNVRPVDADGRQAGVGFRGDDRPPALTPIFGATVTADRPALAWPPAPEAKRYRVRLVSGAGRELWRAETPESRLTFPEGQEALRRGYVYRWEVTDDGFRPVASGEFSVATDAERKQIDDLNALAARPDRADRLAAALSYRRLACFAEALDAFERLAREAPAEPFYRRMLADLYRQAGGSQEARAAASGPAQEVK